MSTHDLIYKLVEGLEKDPGSASSQQELAECLSEFINEIEDSSIESLTPAVEYALKLTQSMEAVDSAEVPKDLSTLARYFDELFCCLDNGGEISDVEAPSFSGVELFSEEEEASGQLLASLGDELVQTFASECNDQLSELEVSILAAENPENTEALEDTLRILHTLKGDCGVISLDVGQNLCHEAESMIERCQQASLSLPVDPLLKLVDWFKSSVIALCENPDAPLPASTVLNVVLTTYPTPQDLESVGMTASKAEEVQKNMNVADSTPPLEPVACTPEKLEESIQEEVQEEMAKVTPTQAEVPAEPVMEQQEEEPAAVSAAPTAQAESPAPEPESPTTEAEAPVVAEGCIEFTQESLEDESLDEFVEEAREHLANAESALLELDPEAPDMEHINSLFRGFHTIKGVAGFMNLGPIVTLAHKTEELLDFVRDGAIQMDRQCIDLCFSSNDLLGKIMNQLTGSEAPQQSQLDLLLVSLQQVIDEKGSKKVSLVEVEKAKEEIIRQEAAIAVAAVAPKANAVTSSPSASGKSKRVESNVKVNTARLDTIIDMVGELVIAQQMVVEDPGIEQKDSDTLDRKLDQVTKITRDLQSGAMALRMVTLKQTFQKMSRLVRDVATKAGKVVQFNIEGEETELDRNVVEAIGDPLVHMIRNAIDHGLEGPEERIAAGKEETGQVTLSAYHQGGSIIIEIKEDGRGLSREKILSKAIERGLVSEGPEADNMPQADVNMLIFRPGFSTAEAVTDISGRGVGMDVVRKNIEALRGKIEIDTVAGSGTTFRIVLPLTLAIIDGMLISIANQRFVIPTESIERSFRPLPGEVESIVNRGEAVMVQGSLVPVIRMSDVFGIQGGCENPEEGILIALDAHGARGCILVDEILGQHQVVIKSLGKGMRSSQGISGGAILGDGTVGLIMDVSGLLELASPNSGGASSSPKDELENMVHVTEAKAGQYLSFCLSNQLYAMAILSVREILENVEITTLPSSPSFLTGVINLRGSILPVIDLRTTLGIKTDSKFTCIIIIEAAIEGERNGVQIGCIVDQVDDVLNLREEDISAPPESDDPSLRFMLGVGTQEDGLVSLISSSKLISLIAN